MKKFERVEWEQKTQVRSHALLHYAIPHPRPDRHYKQFTQPTYSGQMTDHAARRIRKTIDLFFQLSPVRLIFNEVSKRFQNFQLNFITLTISARENVCSKWAYENLLAPLLRKIRKLGKVSYVWKGEYQKRGQPHFHLTTNAFVHMTWIRSEWNNLQTKHGLLDDYRAEHGHDNAPSTETKSVRNLKRIDLYLAKYISKKDGGKKWNGKVWGCSDNLRNGHQFSFGTSYDDEERLTEQLEKGSATLKRFDNFSITETDNPKDCLTPARKTELAAHLSNLK